MGASGWVHLDVEKILRETDAAFLVRLDGGEEVWLPRSQIADPDDYAEGDAGVEISVTGWIARQKGLGD